MSLENMIRSIKEIHHDYVVLIKIGAFYHAYGKDAYIIGYLFGYKRKSFGDNSSTCGFPKNTLAFVESKLEDKKINYIVIDRAHQYEVEEKVDFKRDNKYFETYNKAYKNIRIQERALDVYNYIIDNIEDENIRKKLGKIEEEIYGKEGKICSH